MTNNDNNKGESNYTNRARWRWLFLFLGGTVVGYAKRDPAFAAKTTVIAAFTGNDHSLPPLTSNRTTLPSPIQSTKNNAPMKKKLKKADSAKKSSQGKQDTADSAALPNAVKKKKTKKGKRQQSSQGRKNKVSTSSLAIVRRLHREWKDAIDHGYAYDWIRGQAISSGNSTLTSSASYNYLRLGPWGSNLLEWHFSVTGPSDSVYEQGIYHGRILLPKNYPLSPPRIQIITPSGRFIPGEDICTTASHYHPEAWTPQWTLLGIVQALRLHFGTPSNEIGGKWATQADRREYALASRQWQWKSVDHARMIQQGMFGDDNHNANVEEEMKETDEIESLQTLSPQPSQAGDVETIPSAITSVDDILQAALSIESDFAADTTPSSREGAVVAKAKNKATKKRGKRTDKTKTMRSTRAPSSSTEAPEHDFSSSMSNDAELLTDPLSSTSLSSSSSSTFVVPTDATRHRRRRQPPPTTLAAILAEHGIKIWQDPPRLLGLGLLLLFVWLNRS